jgi:Spy/CpxP family protein refolding chaperone
MHSTFCTPIPQSQITNTQPFDSLLLAIRERFWYNSEKLLNNHESVGKIILKEVLKMERKKAFILISIVAMIAILGSVVLTAYAAEEENNHGFARRFIPMKRSRSWRCSIESTFENSFNLDLTDVQREEVKQLIEDMQASDATREEIMSAVREMLNDWGIEASDCMHCRIGGTRGLAPSWAEDLTDEQKGELRQIMNDMMEQTRAKIREKLEVWGIEIP